MNRNSSSSCAVSTPDHAANVSIQVLNDAARYNECAALQREIDAGGDVNWNRYDEGTTPLMTAASYGSVAAMTLLLSNGADINVQDKKGKTALMCAVECSYGDQKECLDILLRHGADLDVQDEFGCTALHTAIGIAETCDKVEALVDAGINVNLCDQRGCTALHNVCRRPLTNLVEELIPILIKGGTITSMKNKKGQLAFEMSASDSGKCRSIIDKTEKSISVITSSSSYSNGKIKNGINNTSTTNNGSEELLSKVKLTMDYSMLDKPLERKLVDLKMSLDLDLLSKEEFFRIRSMLFERFLES